MRKLILPIGSIVLLQDLDAKIIIIGHLMHNKDLNKIYDYCGCGYPTGFVSKDRTLYFNKSDIKKVLKIGYMDEESLRLNQKIEESIKKQNK